jgi:hypothetical protein
VTLIDAALVLAVTVDPLCIQFFAKDRSWMY